MTSKFIFLAIGIAAFFCLPIKGATTEKSDFEKQKKVLLVGGAGFIGSCINKMLSQEGYATIVLDNLSRGHPNSVVAGDFIQGDLEDLPFLNRLFSENQIDAVIHLAAFTDVGESCLHPQLYYKNNVVNSMHLLQAMIENDVSLLIFSSSAAIFSPSASPIAEDHPCNPLSPYGQTKLITEQILRDYSLAYPFRYCSLRYFNVVGGDPDGLIKNYKVKESNLVAKVLRGLKNNDRFFTVFGCDYPTDDGTCVRDYIHVWDLARAHLLALERLLAGGNSAEYNLGNGQGFSVLKVLQTIKETTGSSFDIIYGDRRSGDAPISVSDPRKAESELGWRPQYSLRDMIEDSWKALL